MPSHNKVWSLVGLVFRCINSVRNNLFVQTFELQCHTVTSSNKSLVLFILYYHCQLILKNCLFLFIQVILILSGSCWMLVLEWTLPTVRARHCYKCQRLWVNMAVWDCLGISYHSMTSSITPYHKVSNNLRFFEKNCDTSDYYVILLHSTFQPVNQSLTF